jgi:tetratricopeptide (TPR) repeat protein
LVRVLGLCIAFAAAFVPQSHAQDTATAQPEARPRLPLDELFPLTEIPPLLDREIEVPASPRDPVVFLAPLFSKSGMPASETNVFDRMLRFHLQCGALPATGLNMLTDFMIRAPYEREAGGAEWRGRKPEEYLRDAQLLGAQIFVYGREVEDAGTIAVQLAMVDLRTSRTGNYNSTVPKAEVGKVLGGAVEAVGRFAGLTDRQMADARMTTGMPSEFTYDFLSLKEFAGAADARALVRKDPDSPFTRCAAIESGWDSIPIANEALKKWPDDPRLIMAKVRALNNRDAGVAAFILLTETLRKRPADLSIACYLRRTVRVAFPQEAEAAMAPPPLVASVGTLRNLADRFPDNWYLQWYYGDIAGELAGLYRGTRTIDQIPRQNLMIYAALTSASLARAEAAVQRRPDCPNLLAFYLDAAFHSGQTDPEFQRGLIARIATLDPDNVKPWVTAAYSHSVGWDSEPKYAQLIEAAVGQFRGKPKALARIADSLAQDFRRRLAFGLQTTATIYSSGKEPGLLTYCVEEAMAAKEPMNSMAYGTAMAIYRERGEQDRAAAVENAFKLAYHSGPTTHEKLLEPCKRGDYEPCLKNMSYYVLRGGDAKMSAEWRHLSRYWFVKSLWKLGKLDESMDYSEKFIAEFPDKHTFYYLFAIVALERNDRLEKAYEYAKRGVELVKDNEGLNKTHEKLKAKLGK